MGLLVKALANRSIFTFDHTIPLTVARTAADPSPKYHQLQNDFSFFGVSHAHRSAPAAHSNKDIYKYVLLMLLV